MSYRKLRKQLPIKGAFMRRIMITGFKLHKQLPIKGAFMRRIMITGFAERFL